MSISIKKITADYLILISLILYPHHANLEAQMRFLFRTSSRAHCVLLAPRIVNICIRVRRAINPRAQKERKYIYLRNRHKGATHRLQTRFALAVNARIFMTLSLSLSPRRRNPAKMLRRGSTVEEYGRGNYN